MTPSEGEVTCAFTLEYLNFGYFPYSAEEERNPNAKSLTSMTSSKF